jgi:hypothetical protein
VVKKRIEVSHSKLEILSYNFVPQGMCSCVWKKNFCQKLIVGEGGDQAAATSIKWKEIRNVSNILECSGMPSYQGY